MKIFIRICLLTVGLLSTSIVYSANETKLVLLQSLLEKNLKCNRDIPADSVILWCEEIEPGLLREKRYKEYFELKYLEITTHSNRGDVSLAVDGVRLMIDEAQKLNFDLGVALAGQAIGDTHAYSSMRTEAIKSYKEALTLYDKIPDSDVYKKRTLLRLVHVLMQLDITEETTKYFAQLNSMLSNNPDEEPLLLFVTIYNAYYQIKTGNFDEAKRLLDEASLMAKNQAENGCVIIATLRYITARYYQETGEYDLALKEYNRINSYLTSKLDANRYSDITMNKARLLVKMGRTDDAAHLYQRINEVKDSLNSKSYTRQVNRLHTAYTVSTIEVENQAQQANLVKMAIIVTLCILAFSILLFLYIRKGNKQLAESKLKLEKAKKQAENSARSKSMFLSNMSHEIRTPLNALTGFSAILTEESIDSETRLQCNEIIQQNSELLLKLINDVIDLSSLEFGKMQFNFRHSDAVSICRNVVDMVDKIKQTQAAILFNTSLEELELYTDDARLQQVLINLLINATKFTSVGSITLSLELQSDDTALFSVTDTGCGIALEKQKQIFNRFEKLDELDQGTGLGLSICQLIIKHIGGEIWIDPEYTGGARFCFTHPINKQNKEQ